MATGKKSVVLYCDIIHMVEKLDNETAGELFKHYLRYVNDLNPTTINPIVDIAFEPIKQQLKRDLQKWEGIRVKRSEAGKASAKKRQQVSTSVESVQQTSTNPTVNGNVTVNVTDTVNVKKNIEERKQVFILQSHEINAKKNYLSDFEMNDEAKGFIFYWTEHGLNDKKMKFEKQKSFSISRRMATWRDNAKKFGNKTQSSNGQLNDRLNKIKD